MSKGFYPNFSITNQITQGLTRIERARGFLDAASLSDEWLREMERRALILEGYHTTHIEGTHLTLDQAALILEGKPVSDADHDDAMELLNYKKAFEFVSEYLEEGGPITEGLIREIHKRLVDGVSGGAGAPGTYRSVQNYVVSSVTGETIYTPPPPQDVPVMMHDLVHWLNAEKEVHPVLLSGIAQFQLVHIHPFLDGNGRTSRLLSTLCLYRAGYDFKRLFTISKYYDQNRSAFYNALQNVRKQNMDLTGWLEYFVEGLTVQLSEIRKKGEGFVRAQELMKKHQLSERQEKVLAFLFDHGELTIRDLEQLYPDASRRSLQRDLKAMTDLGLLIVEGSTNKRTYRLRESG